MLYKRARVVLVAGGLRYEWTAADLEVCIQMLGSEVERGVFKCDTRREIHSSSVNIGVI